MSVLFQLLPTFPPRVLMGVLWDNQLISGRIWSSFDLTPMCALIFFLYLNYFWWFYTVYWRTSRWWYHWRGELCRWRSVCQRYPLHDLHQNMCEGSWSIPYFLWFLHLLLWSNIGGDSLHFHEFSFSVKRWVHGDGAWDIPWHFLEQERQVMLVH